MTQSTVIRYPKGMQFFDQNGKPLALGKLTYQVAGGSPLQDTWTDSAGIVPNANPVLLDGSGRTSQDIYLGSTGLSNYKETLTDSTGATVSPWPADNIPKATGTTGVSTDLSLTLRSGDADLNIVTGSGVNLPGATASLAGLMSAADKTKVNNLSGLYVATASGVSVKNNAVTPNSKIDVVTGNTIMTDTAGNGTWVASASGTIDLSVSAQATGNCLDTGALAPTQWYHVYQITNGTLVAFLASLSATAPTLPSGYTKFIRLGAMTTDGSSALYRMLQVGNKTRYQLVNATNTATYPFILTDASGVAILKQVRGNGFGCPPTAAEVMLILTMDAASTGVTVAPNSVGTLTSITNASYVWMRDGPAPFTSMGVMLGILLENDTVTYLASSTTAENARVIGWVDRTNVLS